VVSNQGIQVSGDVAGDTLSYDGEDTDERYAYSGTAVYDLEYLRLDATNDPVTGSLEVHNSLEHSGTFGRIIQRDGNFIDFYRDGANYLNATTAGGYFIVRTSGTAINRITMDDGGMVVSGRLGINMPTPLSPLDIRAEVGAGTPFKIRNASNTDDLAYIYQDASESARLYLNDGSTDTVKIGAGEYTYFNLANGITIGDLTQPSGYLDVKGNTFVRGTLSGVTVQGLTLEYKGQDTDERYAISGAIIDQWVDTDGDTMTGELKHQNYIAFSPGGDTADVPGNAPPQGIWTKADYGVYIAGGIPATSFAGLQTSHDSTAGQPFPSGAYGAHVLQNIYWDSLANGGGGAWRKPRSSLHSHWFSASHGRRFSWMYHGATGDPLDSIAHNVTELMYLDNDTLDINVSTTFGAGVSGLGLSGLDDVQSTGWTSGQIGVYDGTQWIPAAGVTVTSETLSGTNILTTSISGQIGHFDGIQLTAEPTVYNPSGTLTTIWLKNSDLATYGYSEGQSVSGWLDSGPTGRDYSEAPTWGDGTNPVYRADAWNGYPAIETDGSGILLGSDENFSATFVLAAVYKTSPIENNFGFTVGQLVTGPIFPGNSATASGVIHSNTPTAFTDPFDNTPAGIHIGILRREAAGVLKYSHDGVDLSTGASDSDGVNLQQLLWMSGTVAGPLQHIISASGTQLLEMVFWSGVTLSDDNTLGLYKYFKEVFDECPKVGGRRPLEIVNTCGETEVYIDGDAAIYTEGTISEGGELLGEKYVLSGVDPWVDEAGDTMTGALEISGGQNLNTVMLTVIPAETQYQSTTDIIRVPNPGSPDLRSNFVIEWSGCISNDYFSPHDPLTILSRTSVLAPPVFSSNEYAFRLEAYRPTFSAAGPTYQEPGLMMEWVYSGLQICTMDKTGQLFFGDGSDSYTHINMTTANWTAEHIFNSRCEFRDEFDIYLRDGNPGPPEYIGDVYKRIFLENETQELSLVNTSGRFISLEGPVQFFAVSQNWSLMDDSVRENLSGVVVSGTGAYYLSHHIIASGNAWPSTRRHHETLYYIDIDDLKTQHADLTNVSGILFTLPALEDFADFDPIGGDELGRDNGREFVFRNISTTTELDFWIRASGTQKIENGAYDGTTVPAHGFGQDYGETIPGFYSIGDFESLTLVNTSGSWWTK
jgi:hypothetical protein